MKNEESTHGEDARSMDADWLDKVVKALQGIQAINEPKPKVDARYEEAATYWQAECQKMEARNVAKEKKIEALSNLVEEACEDLPQLIGAVIKNKRDAMLAC
jgi:hypothetical protein